MQPRLRGVMLYRRADDALECLVEEFAQTRLSQCAIACEVLAMIESERDFQRLLFVCELC